MVRSNEIVARCELIDLPTLKRRQLALSHAFYDAGRVLRDLGEVEP
jgi:hypothetical protein